MTWYLRFRSQAVAGIVIDPRVYEWRDGDAGLKPVPDLTFAQTVRDKDVLLATHGFNVDQTDGLQSLGGVDARLRPSSSELLLGVLWPGDWWIPVVNYPFEASDAVDSGKRLARFCNQRLKSARSLSFVSHSLGARLILEAVKRLDRPARNVCVTAAAADFDCLDRQYAGAVENCAALSNLASRKDRVLKYAYPAGDLVSDVLGDDDSPFNQALGRSGPKRPYAQQVVPHQIADDMKYDHGHYLPDNAAGHAAPNAKWPKAVEFMIRAFRNEPQIWP